MFFHGLLLFPLYYAIKKTRRQTVFKYESEKGAGSNVVSAAIMKWKPVFQPVKLPLKESTP
jgi:hypothetical protein